MIRDRASTFFAITLVAPATLAILAVVAYPLVDSINLSFTNAALKPTYSFVGLANYEKIFRGNIGEVILRTFLWTFCSVALKMLLGTLGAVLLNAAVPGRALFRILTMPPWIIPIAIGIFMWGWLYNGQFGMISGLLQNFGLTDGPLALLGRGETAFWATIVTDVWVGVPMVTIYFLAAIQAIPRDLYEAAWVDGAGRWMRFARITFPLLVPALLTMSMLSMIFTFNSFDIIWVLTQGGPSGDTTTMIIDTCRTAIGSYKYGEGSARAVLICIVIGLFSFAYFRLVSRLNQGERL